MYVVMCRRPKSRPESCAVRIHLREKRHCHSTLQFLVCIFCRFYIVVVVIFCRRIMYHNKKHFQHVKQHYNICFTCCFCY